MQRALGQRHMTWRRAGVPNRSILRGDRWRPISGQGCSARPSQRREETQSCRRCLAPFVPLRGWTKGVRIGAVRATTFVVSLIALLAATARARGAARPATRNEATTACLKGCVARVEKGAPATKQQRLDCEDSCACIVDEMFEPGGKRKRDPKELPEVVNVCAKRLQAKQADRADTPPPTESVDSQPVAPAPLILGRGCGVGGLPSFEIDRVGERVRLVGGGFSLRVPKGWTAALERPELVVISAPQSIEGVHPVFEVFVADVCASYDQPLAARRVAGRGLAELMTEADSTAQIQGERWSTDLRGRLGRSLIHSDVTLRTRLGERKVTLYATHLRDAKTFSLHASAVCPAQKPKPGANPGDLGSCSKTYFAMLEAAEYRWPP